MRSGFWEDVVKQKNKKLFGSSRVIVVVFARYYLDNEKDSPVVFSSQPRIGHTELLLKESEAIVLF